MYQKNLFDEWPERYESWFSTPIGKLVKSFETELILELARPGPYEKTLDAGCGTGVFTSEFLANKASVTGLDISRPMLEFAAKKFKRYSFQAVQGNITCLPFKDNYFDITISITTLEFVEDARAAVNELFRVTKSEGIILVATLNSLSPWAARRNAKTQKGEKHVLETAYYGS
jgi:ubiquinone/menaquinone biosynthesis C-methylase UbiE